MKKLPKCLDCNRVLLSSLRAQENNRCKPCYNTRRRMLKKGLILKPSQDPRCRLCKNQLTLLNTYKNYLNKSNYICIQCHRVLYSTKLRYLEIV